MRCVRCPGPLGCCSPVCAVGVLCCMCGVLGNLASFHQWARWLCCALCAVSWPTWLLFTEVSARCVVLCVRCPGPLGSCSLVRTHGVLCCESGVLGHLASSHRCARSVCCIVCAVPWTTWFLSTSVPAPCVVLFEFVRSACSVACAVSCASWLLCTGVYTRRVVLHVRCPQPRRSCSPVCPLGVFSCVSAVLGHLAPVHRCVRSACCVACAVSLATCLLFTGVHARCVVLCVWSPRAPGSCSLVCPLCLLCCLWCSGSLGSCSPVCTLRVLCCMCGVLGNLAPVHRCDCSVCCAVCAVSWATWLLFTGVPARCVVWCVRSPGPFAS